jgi:hypothetical protein
MVANPKKLLIDKLPFISLLLMVFLSSDLYAQKFSLGIKAGPLGMKSTYGDKDEGKLIDDKVKWGYYTAAFISFPLKDHYSCVVETGFSRKGRNVYFDNGDSKNFATYHFIDGALLLRRSFKLYLGKNIPADWFVNIGPHISYWLNGKGTLGNKDSDGTAYDIKFTKSGTGDVTDFNTVYMVDANRWLFGVDIGVGMTAPIRSTTRIMAELRFTWGHTYYGGIQTANYSSWSGFKDRNMKANEKVLSFTIAYMLDFNVQEGRKGHSTKDKEVKRKKVKRRRR